MLTVLDYLQIRTAHAQGQSMRSLARRLHRSQKTIRKVIGSSTGQPAPYRRSGPAVYPKLGPFIGFIEQVLKDDLTAPPKQRHTAMQIYRRMVGPEFAMPYTGEYNAVRRYTEQLVQFKKFRGVYRFQNHDGSLLQKTSVGAAPRLGPHHSFTKIKFPITSVTLLFQRAVVWQVRIICRSFIC